MKKITLTIIALFAFLTILPYAQAVFWGCFNKGEIIDFCNPAVEDRVAPNNGYMICMSSYNATRNCYNQGSHDACNFLNQACIPGGNNTIDQEPPQLNITSPQSGSVYSDRRVLFSVTVNERSNIYFRKHGETSWKTVCQDCLFYVGERSLDEGLNNLTFKAVDAADNEGFAGVVFNVDTQDPKIRKILPASGFSDGKFSVEFEELNPKSVMLGYGNNQSGNRKQNVSIGGCTASGTRYLCNVTVNLLDFNEETITYYFNVTDIANNVVQSKIIQLSVDTINPVITSFDYQKDGKNIFFSIGITEPNFASVEYIDNLDEKPKWKKICSKLVNGKCEKKLSFKDTQHQLVFRVKDLAGNSATRNLDVETDSKIPKISKTEPKNGWADGEFFVEFKEDHPVEITLLYGNNASGMRSKSVPVGTCVIVSSKYQCTTQVSLNDYDGEEIGYWFEVRDNVGNLGASKMLKLMVDTTYPIILNPNTMYNVTGTSVQFKINIDEDNFEVVQYSDNGGSWKNLCTALTAGTCSKKITLSIGSHQLTVQVYDEAGNSVGKSVNIIIS